MSLPSLKPEAAEAPRRFSTVSDMEIEPLYTPDHLNGWRYDARLGDPGEYPFTRGAYPSMYRGKLWTMRQFAGFGTPEDTNARFRFLLGQGQTGLSVAFDLPTQMGLDSDDPRSEGEVGQVGVAIDSLADMEALFADIPLGNSSNASGLPRVSAIRRSRTRSSSGPDSAEASKAAASVASRPWSEKARVCRMSSVDVSAKSTSPAHTFARTCATAFRSPASACAKATANSASRSTATAIGWVWSPSTATSSIRTVN